MHQFYSRGLFLFIHGIPVFVIDLWPCHCATIRQIMDRIIPMEVCIPYLNHVMAVERMVSTDQCIYPTFPWGKVSSSFVVQKTITIFIFLNFFFSFAQISAALYVVPCIYFLRTMWGSFFTIRSSCSRVQLPWIAGSIVSHLPHCFLFNWRFWMYKSCMNWISFIVVFLYCWGIAFDCIDPLLLIKGTWKRSYSTRVLAMIWGVTHLFLKFSSCHLFYGLINFLVRIRPTECRI